MDFDVEKVDDSYVIAYSNKLRLSFTSGVIVPFKHVQIGNRNPLPKECYKNVHEFVAIKPCFTSQYGWFFIEDREKNEVVFDAHAVVQDSNGSLIDITPTAFRLPFIKSMMKEEKFEELINYLHQKNGNARLTVSL